MNHKVLLKACIAVLAILTGCTADNHNKYIIKTGDIYIVAGAVTGTTTKVAYEYDQKESIHRTVWSENEELYVAAYADGSRVNADGTSWSLFSTLTTDEGFNK